MTPDINSIIGTPYVLGGRDPRVGLDCWGLILHVYRAMGRPLADFDSKSWSRTQIIKQIGAGERQIARKVDEPEQWCIVSDYRKGHVGLWVDGAVLHAARGMGVVMQPWLMFVQSYPDSKFFKCHD